MQGLVLIAIGRLPGASNLQLSKAIVVHMQHRAIGRLDVEVCNKPIVEATGGCPYFKCLVPGPDHLVAIGGWRQVDDLCDRSRVDRRTIGNIGIRKYLLLLLRNVCTWYLLLWYERLRIRVQRLWLRHKWLCIGIERLWLRYKGLCVWVQGLHLGCKWLRIGVERLWLWYKGLCVRIWRLWLWHKRLCIRIQRLRLLGQKRLCVRVHIHFFWME